MTNLTPQISVGSLRDALNESKVRSGFQALIMITPSRLDHSYENVAISKLKVVDTIPWTSDQQDAAVSLIKSALERGRVLICSDMGVSRCAAAVFFYLCDKGMSKDDALKWIKDRYPEANPHQAILTGERKVSPISTYIPSASLHPTLIQHTSEKIPLSVVMVTWNRKEVVRKSIESILKNTSKPFEFIVVDNGSSDGTLEYLLSLDGICVVPLGQNFGKGKAANVGMKMAKGEWISYFDSDIIVPDGWFEKIRLAYETIPNAGWLTLAYNGIEYKDGLKKYGDVTLSCNKAGISGWMVFFRQDKFDKLGGFVEDRLYGLVDIEYAKRAMKMGYVVGYVISDKRLVHLGDSDSKEYKAWKKAERKRSSMADIPMPELLPPKNVADIVVVRYNVPDMEYACIRSVKEHTSCSYRLTVVDNYETKENLGALWNRMIDRSPCDYICLLNSDCLVTNNWLEKMMDVIVKKGSDIVAVGPSTNQCATEQKIAEGLLLKDAEKYAAELPEKIIDGVSDEKVIPTSISGFCYLLRKDLWEKIGKFSEEFAMFGQETEFNVRAQQLGYSTVWVRDSFVYHHGSASVKKAAKEEGFNAKLDRKNAKKKIGGAK